jgi:hypothetical protein
MEKSCLLLWNGLFCWLNFQVEAGACFSQIKVTERMLMEIQKAFLDTNVLLRNIIGGDEQKNDMVEILRSNNFQIVTFQKCVCELYSMVKSIVISELSGTHKDDPIKHVIPTELIDICAVLREKFTKRKISQDDIFFWYNQCEEWCDRDFTEELRCIENDIKSYEPVELKRDIFQWKRLMREGTISIDRKIREKFPKELNYIEHDVESYESVELERDIYLWKYLIRESFRNIDRKIRGNFIHVYTYHDVYNSYWYNSEGYAHEDNLMKDSFLPNEDFEIIMAAAFCNASVFITNDQMILRRTGASWGTCCGASFTSFCCPERLEEAINSQFDYRSYPSLKLKE